MKDDWIVIAFIIFLLLGTCSIRITVKTTEDLPENDAVYKIDNQKKVDF